MKQHRLAFAAAASAAALTLSLFNPAVPSHRTLMATAMT